MRRVSPKAIRREALRENTRKLAQVMRMLALTDEDRIGMSVRHRYIFLDKVLIAGVVKQQLDRERSELADLLKEEEP